MSKICTICKEEKADELFSKRSDGKNKLHSACKKCEHKKGYELLKSNPIKYEKQKEQWRILRKLRRQKIDEKINHIKLEKGCLCCGYKDFSSALAFHHIDPIQKENQIANMRAKGIMAKWDEIQKEIDKCVVLCFNCHIALHQGLISIPSSSSSSHS